MDWFLVLWLTLELASYFVLSPLPGVRRVLGLVVVGTFVSGRLASRTCQVQPRKVLVNAVALANIVLGLGMHAVEAWDARAEQVAVRQVVQFLRQKPRRATTWFRVDCWCGFHVYAKWAGLRTIGAIDERLPRPGELLVVMSRPANQPMPTQPPGERIGRLEIQDSLPLRTIPSYWCGRTALEHHEGPRAVVDIYRLR